MNNYLKYSLIALPILVGGFLIYKKLNPKKKEGTTPPPPPPTPSGEPKPPTSPVINVRTKSDDFPIGIGSRGAKVIELQQAIVNDGQPNIVSLLGSNPTDGKFGTGTEKAVKALLGKTKIDSQADIDKIKGLSAARVSSALQTAGKNDRIALANKLISLFKQNPATREFYAIQDLGGSIYKVTTDGREILESSKVWKKGEAIGTTRSGLSRNAKFVVNSSGFIQAYDGSLMVYFSPYGVEVK
jgi:peptidoglycan hydrolase-like protein with peptidoglycan-binding domain